MSQRMKQGIGMAGLMAVIAALLAGAALLAPLRGSQAADVIVIEARDMAFWMGSGEGAVRNPELHLRADRPVEILFRNRDPGMRHDLVLEALGLRSGSVAPGEEVSIRFTPAAVTAPGDYYCSMHPRSMRGRLTIQ